MPYAVRSLVVDTVKQAQKDKRTYADLDKELFV